MKIEEYIIKLNELSTSSSSIDPGFESINTINKKDLKKMKPKKIKSKKMNPPLVTNESLNENELSFDIKNNAKKRIMIDFDRVIHDYCNGWDDGKISGVIPGAKQVIDFLKINGFEVIIFTTRVSKSLHIDIKEETKKIGDWLNKNNIKVDGITSDKLPAIVYIDDRAINFDPITMNWVYVIEQIQNIIQKYNKD